MLTTKIKIIIALSITAILSLYMYKKYHVAPTINLSSLSIIDENGKVFDIKALKGKKVILSFYASWCPDCLKELKHLNAVRDQQLSDVVILAVTDETIEKLINFKTKKQYPFTFLKLNQSFNDIKIYSIPTTYLINTNGEIVYEKVGYINWEDHSTLNHLKTIMN